jgi:hypothetical protein
VSEIPALRHVDDHEVLFAGAERLLELAAIAAERVGELDDGLRPSAEIIEVDPIVVAGADAPETRQHAVHRAAHAETGNDGERREGRDHADQDPSGGVRAEEMEDRGAQEEGRPEDVREARGPGILDRALAEAGLDHLEVEEAGEAVLPPEGQPDRELNPHQGGDPPGPREERQAAEGGDHGLVEAGGALVYDQHVPVGVGGALRLQLLHYFHGEIVPGA